MPTFEYIAKDRAGREFNGTYDEITGTDALRGELARIGYELVRARRVKEHSSKSSRIKATDIVTFAY